MNENHYHLPIMVDEAIESLGLKAGGTYVDLTFGGGGHAKAILDHLSGGQLWAFDQDSDARAEAEKIADDRLTFIQGNFRFWGRFLSFYGIKAVDGIFADLGMSSYQLDTTDRGFAVRLGGPLDMRMNQDESVADAATLLNQSNGGAISDLLKRYGDVREAKKVARAILAFRQQKPLATIEDLREALQETLPKRGAYKFYAKVFQAIRIAVNDEESALIEMLEQVPRWLKPGGRLVLLTYHSGEDRLVKSFIRAGNFDGKVVQDPFGNTIRPLKPFYRKPIYPSEVEIAANNRARSAKMRVAVKV